MTLLAGLVIQTDVTGEYQEIFMSVLLIIINGSVVVLGLVSTALMLPNMIVATHMLTLGATQRKGSV